MFAQVKCKQGDGVLKNKEYTGLLCSALIFICGFVFLFSLNRMSTSCAVDNKVADMLLCTLDDYAVELDLSDRIYRDFRAWYGKKAEEENKPLIVMFE